MAFSGTDIFHELEFVKQAENYRRVFIQTLNDKHAYGGSKTGDWDWKADTAFFKSIKDFEYAPPSINNLWAKYLIDVFMLFTWTVLTLALVNYSSKRISIV